MDNYTSWGEKRLENTPETYEVALYQANYKNGFLYVSVFSSVIFSPRISIQVPKRMTVSELLPKATEMTSLWQRWKKFISREPE